MTKSSCKRLLMIITVVSLAAMFLTNTSAFAMSESTLIDQLDGLNAHQALALANQWYWEKQPVKTHITPKEVVFQFESGTVKKIPLPANEMLVAVAPFIDKTHK